MTPPQCNDTGSAGFSVNWVISNKYTAQLSNLVGGVMTPPYKGIV